MPLVYCSSKIIVYCFRRKHSLLIGLIICASKYVCASIAYYISLVASGQVFTSQVLQLTLLLFLGVFFLSGVELTVVEHKGMRSNNLLSCVL